MMIMVTGYISKKELQGNVGRMLVFEETSFFGPEYKSNGTFPVVHRPSVSKKPGREFFAEVTMENDVIVKVV